MGMDDWNLPKMYVESCQLFLKNDCKTMSIKYDGEWSSWGERSYVTLAISKKNSKNVTSILL